MYQENALTSLNQDGFSLFGMLERSLAHGPAVFLARAVSKAVFLLSVSVLVVSSWIWVRLDVSSSFWEAASLLWSFSSILGLVKGLVTTRPSS